MTITIFRHSVPELSMFIELVRQIVLYRYVQIFSSPITMFEAVFNCLYQYLNPGGRGQNVQVCCNENTFNVLTVAV